MELADKVAVITGASMGIGEAIAKLFVERGARRSALSRRESRGEARVPESGNQTGLSPSRATFAIAKKSIVYSGLRFITMVASISG